jgi:hypothetical protein
LGNQKAIVAVVVLVPLYLVKKRARQAGKSTRNDEKWKAIYNLNWKFM